MRGELPNKIRRFLLETPGPHTVDAIAIGVGMFGSLLVLRTCNRMKRDGHLIRQEGGYVIGELPHSWVLALQYPTPEARKERERELDLVRCRKKRRAAGAKETPGLTKEARAAKAAAPKQRTLAQRIFATANPDKAFDVTVATPAKPRRQSVEEFIANGGKIQVLSSFAMKPLSLGGHRGMDRQSMRESLEAA